MRVTKELGEGEIVKISSSEYIFKLASYKGNPIIKPQDIGLIWEEDGKPQIGAVFNAGAEFLGNKIILTPRCHKGYKKGKFFDKKLGIERNCLENYISEVWILASEDGVYFKRFHNVVIKGDGTQHKDFVYGIEDIRIIKHSDPSGLSPQGRSFYWLIGCGKIKPPFKERDADRIAIYSTKDFINITYHGVVNSFDSRNAVLFPNYIKGKLYILFRFAPNIHLALVEIEQLLRPFEHKKYWERIYAQREQSLLLSAGSYQHESEKIGAGTQVIKTNRGWLLIYHAVGEIGIDICKSYGLTEGIKRGYSVCAALLDLDDPHKVIARTRNSIYIPSAPYELYGNAQYPVDIPAVVFPVGTVVCEDKLLLYCGAGDKYTILLSCGINKLVDYLWKYCEIQS